MSKNILQLLARQAHYHITRRPRVKHYGGRLLYETEKVDIRHFSLFKTFPPSVGIIVIRSRRRRMRNLKVARHMSLAGYK